MMHQTVNEKKSVAVLGALGSVGTQALDVLRRTGDVVPLLTANRNVTAMEAAAREFSPAVCVMADEAAASDLRTRLADTSVRVLGGSTAITDAIKEVAADVYVNSIVGCAGLLPSLAVIETGKRLALANKESLVVAGEIVMARARETECEVIPVDSEHSAIFQCMHSGAPREVRRILLTASGGPFFGKTRAELAHVTRADALAHPTWQMGAKITVDSATLLNKGFEVIEAVHLFGVDPSQITVTVHRESIIHSAVEYIDGAIIAEMGAPDMRLCVQYALTYPQRTEGVARKLDVFGMGALHFDAPDDEAFPLLPLAFRAIRAGGAVPCVLNAAGEIADAAFLEEKLSFLGIADVIEKTVDAHRDAASCHTLEDILACDRAAREYARSLL